MSAPSTKPIGIDRVTPSIETTMFRRPTFGSMLDVNKQLGPGFAALRVALSIAILWAHAYVITGLSNEAFWQSGVGRLSMCLVPAFFALSGFLVMGSALRAQSVEKFVRFRLVRIAPALSVEVFLTALVIGPIATSLPLLNYFSDQEFWSYFSNIIGFMHYRLPGVFNNLPSQIVNGSLWTIQPEIFCYLWLSYLMISGFAFKPRLYCGFALFLMLIDAYVDLKSGASGDRSIGPLFQFRLFTFFVAGGAMYHMRHSVPYSWSLFIGCILTTIILIAMPIWRALTIPMITYFTMFLGLTPLPLPFIFKKGDYSYGIYLYAYPIQQIVCQSFPNLRTWYWNVAFALPLTLLAAIMSWHLVESPALYMKNSRSSEKRQSVGLYTLTIALSTIACSVYALTLVIWAGVFSSVNVSIRSNVVTISLAIALITALAARKAYTQATLNVARAEPSAPPC